MMEAVVAADLRAAPRSRCGAAGAPLGRTRGRVGFHGGKIEVERPRVRGVDSGEVTIPSWETAAQEDWLGRWATNLMLINVSTRRTPQRFRPWSRGLDPTTPRLFIVDGATGLTKAIRRTFDSAAAIQRCHIHKARNIMERLPKEHHAAARRVLRQA